MNMESNKDNGEVNSYIAPKTRCTSIPLFPSFTYAKFRDKLFEQTVYIAVSHQGKSVQLLVYASLYRKLYEIVLPAGRASPMLYQMLMRLRRLESVLIQLVAHQGINLVTVCIEALESYRFPIFNLS